MNDLHQDIKLDLADSCACGGGADMGYAFCFLHWGSYANLHT